MASFIESSKRKRRRRPFPEGNEDKTTQAEVSKGRQVTDKRAIKRATKLVLEGNTRKAAQVMDQAFTPYQLSEEETLSKLEDLHPQNKYEFTLPSDAPVLVGLEPMELKAAGHRLVKGASPGPTGTTDSLIRILIDDPVCSLQLCHMFTDLINGFLPDEIMRRLKRARIIAMLLLLLLLFNPFGHDWLWV